MSASDFTPAIRERIISIFSDSSKKIDLSSYTKQTRKQIFKDSPDTKQLRKKFESSAYHTASVTIDGMQALAKNLMTLEYKESVKDLVVSVFNDPNFVYNFIQYLQVYEDKKGNTLHIEEYGYGDYRLPNIPQASVSKYFLEFLSSNTKLDHDTLTLIGKNIEAGHLAGVFFLKLKTALGVRTEVSTKANSDYRDFSVSLEGLDDSILSNAAVNSLETILKAVLDADFITSNLITNHQVFIDATKSVLGDNPTLVTELQFQKDNKASGDLLQQAGKHLNNLIKSAISGSSGPLDESYRALVSSLQPLADVILAKAEELKAPLSEQKLYEGIVGNAKNLQALQKTLLETKGSPSYIEAIALNIANVIKTGKALPKIDTNIRTKVSTKKVESIPITAIVKDVAKAVKAIKDQNSKLKSKAKTKVSAKAVVNKVPKSNLSSLQALLDKHLQDVVSANMGNGGERRVLNYRTGRLAASAKVERLTQSREGMITAFYTYMKNPYATFSDGGRQQYPKTRDPKLLISGAIREIAATQAITRLRSVLI